MIEILFICLGNICRSPMAEAVMQHLVAQAGLEQRIQVDSVGTGDWHVGQPPHQGTQQILRRHGLPYAGTARQITADDITRAEYLICMDSRNLADVRRMLPDRVERKLHRLLEFAPGSSPQDVPDPWYTGDFDQTYRLVDAGCRGLLAHIRAEYSV